MNFEIVNVGDVWFPPANVLLHGHDKLKESISSDTRKLVRESMSTATMLVGIMKLSRDTYWLQPVNQNEQTPDVRTMRIIEEDGMPNLMEVQEVEVVTLELNSDEQVDDFLKRTKLSPKKPYPKSTVILCHFDKAVKQAKSWKDVHESLKVLNSPNQVYVLARIDPKKHIYQLVEVNPGLELIEYDVEEELRARPMQRAMKMRRGSDNAVNPTDENYIPFDGLS